MINRTPSPSNQKGALLEKRSLRAGFKSAPTKKIHSPRKEERCDDEACRLLYEARCLDDKENVPGTEPERYGGARFSGATTRRPASLPNQNGAQQRKSASPARHSCFSIDENFLESAVRARAGSHGDVAVSPRRHAVHSM